VAEQSERIVKRLFVGAGGTGAFLVVVGVDGLGQ